MHYLGHTRNFPQVQMMRGAMHLAFLQLLALRILKSQILTY